MTTPSDTPYYLSDATGGTMNEVRSAVERGSDYCHDSTRWFEKEGVWDTYFAPIFNVMPESPVQSSTVSCGYGVVDRDGGTVGNPKWTRWQATEYAKESDKYAFVYAPHRVVRLYRSDDV